MKLTLEVTQVTRGEHKDINTHKAHVKAQHYDSGAVLAFWTTLHEAPLVGAVLEVTVGGVQE